MKKSIFKKVAAVALTAAVVGSVGAMATGCNNGGKETVDITIGVQQTTGNNYEAMVKFLDNIKGEVGFTYNTVLVGRDNNANLTTYQNAIASGTQGIISMVDMDNANTKTLLQDCAEAHCYYTGYMTDFANVTSTRNGATDLSDNEYMLGAVSDGEDGANRGQFLFDSLVETNVRKVVLARFNKNYFPAVIPGIAKFKELVETYNASHDDDFEIYSDSSDNTFKDDGAYQCEFNQQVAAATLTKWNQAGVKGIVCFNSLGKLFLQNLKAQNLTSAMPVWTCGWDDSLVADFGSDKPIRAMCQTPCETIVYPLVRIINAVRGNSYSDEPAGKAKIIEGNYVYLGSTQDLTDGKQHCMNFNENRDISCALINAEGINNLLAGANGASFSKLKSTIASWNTEYVLRRA